MEEILTANSIEEFLEIVGAKTEVSGGARTYGNRKINRSVSFDNAIYSANAREHMNRLYYEAIGERKRVTVHYASVKGQNVIYKVHWGDEEPNRRSGEPESYRANNIKVLDVVTMFATDYRIDITNRQTAIDDVFKRYDYVVGGNSWLGFEEEVSFLIEIIILLRDYHYDWPELRAIEDCLENFDEYTGFTICGCDADSLRSTFLRSF